ncbi:MAG: TetR family transcriptional regulator, partial [Ilumatobacteraceae bacterium]
PASQAAARRSPVQSRSRERINTILDITARLIDEMEPENVTTTVIAEHARISVGSIYSYFKDRAAIFDALVARAIERQDRIIAETRERYRDLPFLDASFHVIDAIAHLYRTEPAFRSLWFSKFVSPEMLAEMRRSDEENARLLLNRIETTHGSRLECADPMAAARMYVALIDVGLGLAFRLDPDGDCRMIEETKQAAGAYLRTYLRTPSTGAPSRPARDTVARRATSPKALTPTTSTARSKVPPATPAAVKGSTSTARSGTATARTTPRPAATQRATTTKGRR